MTSKKHYQAVARKINRRIQELRHGIDNFADPRSIMEYEAREEEVSAMAYGLASIFQDDNPNFDRARFLSACGVVS